MFKLLRKRSAKNDSTAQDPKKTAKSSDELSKVIVPVSSQSSAAQDIRTPIENVPIDDPA